MREQRTKTFSRRRDVGDRKAGVEVKGVEAAGSLVPASFKLDNLVKAFSASEFSFDQLSAATGAFCEEWRLGHGGFGSVYRGVLPSGIPVAVKRMNGHAIQSQGTKEFEHEVSILLQLRHRNLIELRGWCEDQAKHEYMLVYELMPNGSLDDVLFKPAEGTTCLSWPQRFKILTGTAAALEYLHQGWKEQVVHRDIKCSNIMLDKQWNAKLGDFGIARLVHHGREAAATNVAGTFGYIAPEVFYEFTFTDKADVFAFGVVVFEVACGRRVLPSHPHEKGLVHWVREAHSRGDLLSTVDKRVSDFDKHQMKVVLSVGLLCTLDNPGARPSMRRVVQLLAGEVKIPFIPASINEILGFCLDPPRRTAAPIGRFGIFTKTKTLIQKLHSQPAFAFLCPLKVLSTALKSGGPTLQITENSKEVAAKRDLKAISSARASTE